MAAKVAGLLVRAVLLVATTSVGVRPALGQEPQPAAELGTVAGTVVDRSSGDVIIEAGVEVVDQRKRVLTNLEGRYSIKLPPGKYELRFFAPYYKGIRLQDVTIKRGEVTRADAALESAGAAGIQVVEVVAPAKKAAEAAQIAKRKEAAVVSDTISRETMQKTTGSEASTMVKRAPAVSVRDEKFVFVRGLSERYTGALLNGSRLPSPDPLRRAVPLDLFPADFLDSIGIVKTFSPNLPGDFSGGLVELDLRDLPDQLIYSLGISTGGNTQTTFQDFLTYRGSPLDYVAAGTRFRDPPATLPPFSREEFLRRSRRGEGPIPIPLSVAASFENIWSPEITEAPPNFGANFSIGNRYGPFGFQLGALWATEWTTSPNQISREFGVGASSNPNQPGPVEVQTDQRRTDGIFQAKLGAVLTAGYEPTERHRFTFRTFVYQHATDDTAVLDGLVDITTPAQQSQLQYVLDSLAYGQLTGEHKFTDWLLVDWRTALSRTRRDEPDTRLTAYIGTPPEFGPPGAPATGGRRFNNTTFEDLTDTMLDFTIPFRTWLPFTDVWTGLPAKFKFGPAYSYRSRTFNQRVFDYFPQDAALDLTLPPEVILQPRNILDGVVGFQESTDITDSYDATQEIIAGYGLFELPIVRDRLRVVGGVRYEYSLIRLDTGVDATVPGLCPGSQQMCLRRFEELNKNPLPGVNVIASPRDDMNVRLSYGKSVARPEFRELAPTRFPTLIGVPPKQGNPDLVQAEITSYDARWEWFFSPLELLSLGFFYKKLTNPIEPTSFAIPGEGTIDTWFNSASAHLIGFEFEARKNFGFIHERLRPLSLLTNVTWADSSVEVLPHRVFGTNIVTQPTERERRLVGQAPFIVNAAVEYTDPERFTARLLYYTAGNSIEVAGSTGLPDIVFQRRDQLDALLIVPLTRWLGLPISARLSAENILNTPFVFLQGPVVQRRLTTGVKFTFALSLTH